MGDLEWTRPLGLAALALPVLVWLLSIRRERPEPVAVGTFDLWRDMPDEGGGELRRRRVPLSRWLLIAALSCGALALAGPRRARAAPPLVWRAVVDPSPSMFLEHTDDGGAPTGAGTRLEAAVARFHSFVDGAGERAAIEWRRPAPGGVEVETGRALPVRWRRPPRPARRAPVWERHDEPGVLWLTDAAPAAEPARAGIVASGGGPVPGLVGTAGEVRLEWDGARVLEVPGARPRAVSVTGDLAAPILAFARAWAEERGLAWGRAAGAEVALAIVAEPAEPARDAAVGRDGWSAPARVGRAPARAASGAPLATWLAAEVDGELRAVVSWRTGEVRVAVVALGEPAGDPASFAVSWAELLDGAVLPAEGVVALDERRAAGEGRVVAPVEVRPAADEVPRPASWPLVTWLAGAAAGLVFLSLVTGAGRG